MFASICGAFDGRLGRSGIGSELLRKQWVSRKLFVCGGCTMPWADRTDIVDHVIDSYAGTEEKDVPRGRFAVRRMFMWQVGNEVRLGNIEAYAQHLITRFNIQLSERCVSTKINRLLLDLGERIYNRGGHRPAFRQSTEKRPEPEYTVIRRVDAA